MGLLGDIFDASNVFPEIKGLWNDYTGVTSAKSANKTNIKLQREQRDWEEMMSNTQVQRRYADLKAAGVNPLLAAGQGAEVPSVAPARVENVMPGGSQRAIGSAVGSAMKVAQQGLLAAQIDNVRADTGLKTAQSGAVPAHIASMEATIRNLDANTSRAGVLEAGNILDNGLKGMENEQYLQLMPLVLEKYQTELSLAKAKVPGALQRAEAWKGVMGKIYAHAEHLVPMFNSALGAGALGKIGGYMKKGPVKGGGLPGRVIRPSKDGRGKFVDHTTGEIYR